MIAARLARVPVRVYTLHRLPLVTASGMKRRLLEWSEKTSCFPAHEGPLRESFTSGGRRTGADLPCGQAPCARWGEHRRSRCPRAIRP